jgi:hypothetical protein
MPGYLQIGAYINGAAMIAGAIARFSQYPGPDEINPA